MDTGSASQLKVIRRLGQGAFGSVYLAQDRRRRSHAVKVARTGGTAALCNEARVLAEHRGNPFAVQLHGACLEGPQRPYLLLEWCGGGDLSAHKGRMNWNEVAHVLRDVTRGLAALHANGGCHRDLKPSNLLAWRLPDGRGWRVKVSDFGMARRGPPHPGVNDVAGTPKYWASEVWHGAPQNPPSDAYALGVTVLELLSGRRDPEALEALAVPAGLKSLLTSLLHPNPNCRPTDSEILERVAPFTVARRPRAPSIALPAAIVAAVWLAWRKR